MAIFRCSAPFVAIVHATQLADLAVQKKKLAITKSDVEQWCKADVAAKTIKVESGRRLTNAGFVVLTAYA